ncbi:MAG: respiratory nitrate reductase subunit gamma [Desulfobacula sp.]|nr:respiratory nitrate reductase subunit gamma [Desulfobacula sp.]
MDTLNYIILVPMVYLSSAIFIAGMIYRITSIFKKPVLTIPLRIYPEKNPVWLYTLIDTFLMPQVFKAKPVMWYFLIIFHGSVFLLIIGHIELIQMFDIFQIIEHDVFLGKGFIGLSLFVSLLYFLFRRFTPQAKHLSVLEDYILLTLLLMTVILGSEMDWARTWFGFQEMTVEDYQTYLKSLLFFKPDISDVTYSGHSFMLVFHVFFANLFIMFFPFSKMMHAIFTIPLNKIRRG